MRLSRLLTLCCLAVLFSSCDRKENRTAKREQWTVTVGALTREQLVAGLRKTALSEQQEDESFILLVRDSPEFKISPAKEELDLVVVTAEELKLPVDKWQPEVPFDEFKTKITEAGYELVPHDGIAGSSS